MKKSSQTTKRVLSALLSVLLLLSVLPISSFAADGEVTYQREKDGDWVTGDFVEALTDVYSGGTIKLLKDVYLTSTVKINGDFTVTSDDASEPKTITTELNGHGYLLSVQGGTICFENVIFDGGSENGLTAKRAVIAITAGALTLGKGVVIQNNNNTTDSGIGGAACLMGGTLTLDGATIKNNYAYFGGGIGTVSGTFYAESGLITKNDSLVGGGICVWDATPTYPNGTAHIRGTTTVTENNAKAYGGGINCYWDCALYLSGSPVICANTSQNEGETDGGVYLEGNKVGNGPLVVLIEDELTEDAKINFWTWVGKDGNLVAIPAEDYAVTASDLSRLHYADEELHFKLTDGKVYLTDETSEECEHMWVNGVCAACGADNFGGVDETEHDNCICHGDSVFGVVIRLICTVFSVLLNKRVACCGDMEYIRSIKNAF